MHLMALGAFWHRYRMAGRNPVVGPNAPYGARCFLTNNAFATSAFKTNPALIHLMALGAF